MKQNDDFQKKLLATFQVESLERVRSVIDGLLRLEKNADPTEQGDIVESLFRQVHSLKGAAGAVSNHDIERICRSFENIFASLKKGHTRITPDVLDLLHRAVGQLEHLLSDITSASSPGERGIADALTAELERFLAGGVAPSAGSSLQSADAASPPVPQSIPGTGGEASLHSETVRIAVTKLDSLMLQAEELVSTKLSAAQRTADLQTMAQDFAVWKKTWRKVYDDVRALRRTAEKNGGSPRQGRDPRGFLEFMESSSPFLGDFEHRLAAATKTSLRDQRSLTFMVENLLDDAKKAIMFPFSSLLETFPRLVRDLARDQRKDIDLRMQGTGIEIDRRILEAMKDPLIHLMRNCVDHGIEPAGERERKGKPARGTVTVSVSHKNGNKIEVGISDDGAGIDPKLIRMAVAKQGILAESQASALSDEEALSFIFQSGVSTSPMITDLSGRGLGLAIVRERIENLGGQVSVESLPMRGTTFHLILPLTLATFRGILVRLDEHLFIVPAANIERVIGFRKEDVRTVENRETLSLNGEVVSLVRLGDVLGLRERSHDRDSTGSLQAFLLNTVNRRIAFMVDTVMQEQEVLVKTLGPQLARVRNIAGATILGSGRVVPILNVTDLVKSALRFSAGEHPQPASREGGETVPRQSVLVVEDSITARTLLGSIMESAGYSVTTAVDGIDALTKLRTGEFDIVVSDVDMPRMNGFDLTAGIRADKRLTDLPVVLVTALESREDRERGVDVGANAYIVKSSFDQSNLLEVVKRLI
ncbi:MAG: hybrid sensor histidine kinase/response regulator [Ignavibacteriales bacterium]|nr:hybrid sensor histidine kinase/response regulator [Ignavibacteriales bacterium]